MLDNPYVVAVVIAVLSATLFTMYVKFTDKDEKKLSTRFAQVFLSTLAAGISFAFVARPGGDETLNLPFEANGMADF
ncbi:hypothetical protein PBCVNEJV1_714R [Paramecium bursaria Chlorella virus NE-JV-1]|nr:hypothetical protein PBCVNEJV1_714R [Paramecium bursaria Chlorella virus NE-JV-1]